MTRLLLGVPWAHFKPFIKRRLSRKRATTTPQEIQAQDSMEQSAVGRPAGRWEAHCRFPALFVSPGIPARAPTPVWHLAASAGSQRQMVCLRLGLTPSRPSPQGPVSSALPLLSSKPSSQETRRSGGGMCPRTPMRQISSVFQNRGEKCMCMCLGGGWEEEMRT